MKRAALGIRMHSGWGVLVAVAEDANSITILDRRRILTMDPTVPGAKQPYHYASSLALPESEKYLANYAIVSEAVASAAVDEVVRELDGRDYQIIASAILLASGRPLPPLARILVSHPLIHTAEGEFFRHAVSKACECLKISVTAIRERDLDEQATAVFGKAAGEVQRRISSFGRSIGPPWTKDHKTAALAASILLASD